MPSPRRQPDDAVQPSSTPRILVTAGPTEEPIDAVRYLSNRSSGRMGTALAREAARRGCPTTLLLGPVALPTPDSSQIVTHRFRTTDDLAALLAAQWPSHDILIMAAAVADYRPVGGDGTGKRRRTSARWTLELEPTADLVASAAAARAPGQRIVAFALEPADELLDAARAKLARKSVDMIVANPLETMDAEEVAATLLHADGRAEDAPRMSKSDFAGWLLDRLAVPSRSG